MAGALTPEIADSIPLPLNPFGRHAAVKSILANQAFVGEGVEIDHDIVATFSLGYQPDLHYTRSVNIATEEGYKSTLYSMQPLLGRKMLGRVATILQKVDATRAGQ